MSGLPPTTRELAADQPLLKFTLTPEGWEPASHEDAAAIRNDFLGYGAAFATADGRRVDPATVKIRDGKPYEETDG